MIIFKMEMEVYADKWSDEEEKKTFMKNAQDVVNQGLARMTVPDWRVTIKDAEYKDD